jgi:NAD(P)-dependent dehydrogenase (short-subunit alcohol dehydrogenase family)
MKELRLDGKVVAITGALGRIGSAVSQCMCEAGAHVVLLDREQTFENENKVLPSEGEWKTAVFDVTDFSDLDERISVLESSYAPFDGWVNCAYPRTDDWGLPFEEVSSEQWLENLKLQLGSSCILSERIAKVMAQRGGGAIVNMGSIYGEQAPDFAIYESSDKGTPSVYSAVKGGIAAHSRWLASYFGRAGVRVNTVCPGGVSHNQVDPFLSNFNSRTLLGRMAKPREVGATVVFLLSDGGAYITGQSLLVDGGMSCH